MMAVARSAMRAQLMRYARSRGLWGILLLAPIASRYMVSGEDGKGVAIAVGGQLPVLTSPVLGVWLGIVVSTLLLPIGFLYLRSNTTRSQPWQVEECTPASRVAMMLGRFGADIAILFAVLAALTLAGFVLGWQMVKGPFEPWTITRALWMVAAPALMGVAALRIAFDCRPWLRRGWGEFWFFVLWMGSLIAPIAGVEQASNLSSNMYDFAGFIRPMTGGEPVVDQDITIGGGNFKAGRVAMDAEAGLAAPGYAASRLAWALISVFFVALSALLYRPHVAANRQRKTGRIAALLSAAPPPPAKPDAPLATYRASRFPGAVLTEARLLLPGKLWLILAAGAALLGLAGDYRHMGSPAALLLLAFALSAHAGRSEAKGLSPLIAVTATGHLGRRLALFAAGTGLAVLMAVPAALAEMSASPLLLGLLTGAIASALAIGLAMLSRSAFAPRLVLLILWYGYLSS